MEKCLPGDRRTNHPRLQGQGGGSRDRGLAALRPGKSSQNWAERITLAAGLCQTPQGSVHFPRYPATDEAAVA